MLHSTGFLQGKSFLTSFIFVGWVDKAHSFRSARRFGALCSIPDFSRVFSPLLAFNPLPSRVLYTVDFIFSRKTLFDFIKSCGGQIDLKFSGVALLGLLYSPKWKRSFFSKGKVPFSMAGSLLRAVQESFSVKEIYRWKEDRFVFFMK